MKLLLHCCCAPCSVSCVKYLRGEGIDPHLFWYNPNIHPFTEYKTRYDCLLEFAANEKLELDSVNDYGLRFFLKETLDRINERCKKCYSLRLEKTASFAAQNNFTAFSTTLLISPYQDHDAIKKIGEEIAAEKKIEFLYRDFRPLFREGQSLAREKKMYMQKYCGCIFSEEERYKKAAGDKGVINNKKNLSFHITHSPLFERLSILTGKEGLEKLSRIKVLIFGAGGVGSWTAEALVRCGVGNIGIIDHDTICASNINRQVEATSLTIGQAKASALKKRLLEINPECQVTAWDNYFCRDNAQIFGIENADYVIDAIDSLKSKLDLIETASKAGVTLYSSMGMAFKLDPSRIKAASVWKTEGCPLARLVRHGLRKRGFSGDFITVFSNELLPKTQEDDSSCRSVNGSIVTVTATAGLLLASLVLKKEIGDRG
ncbi:MAG: epoxyqueuosine reductase QueH [Treponema sp.]|nr:epoxyqueuosine reductase QueH [Treponema sp.]